MNSNSSATAIIYSRDGAGAMVILSNGSLTRPMQKLVHFPFCLVLVYPAASSLCRTSEIRTFVSNLRHLTTRIRISSKLNAEHREYGEDGNGAGCYSTGNRRLWIVLDRCSGLERRFGPRGRRLDTPQKVNVLGVGAGAPILDFPNDEGDVHYGFDCC